MKTPHASTLAVAFAALTAGCSSDGSAGGDTIVAGETTYEDADTDANGQPTEPASPEPQPANDPMRIEITVEGSGSLEGLDPMCSLDGATGAFNGLYTGEARLDDDGAYVATIANSQASFETPGGCEIPSLEVTTFTEVVVKASLSATTQNCESYCSAKARSYAEAECEGDNDEASCRGQAQSEYSASCTTECTSTTHSIVAEAELGAAAVAELTASGVTGKALGEISVDLTFDHVEDGSGDTVDEAP